MISRRATVLVLTALVGGCARTEPAPTGAAPAPTPAPTPAPLPTPSPTRAPFPERGEVGSVVGEWEDGELLGDSVAVGRLAGRDHLLYAARRAVRGETGEVTYVATGLRDGDRLLRTATVLVPGHETAADGVDLYGGDRLAAAGAATYLLLGAVPGDATVAVEGPGGGPRPVTGTSGDVLPGWTVFHDRAAWDDGWDPVQLAPLTVVTGGERIDVRERSWTG